VGLKEDHQKAKANENHNVHVLKHGEVLSDVRGGGILLCSNFNLVI
jgi:hypothetical protein